MLSKTQVRALLGGLLIGAGAVVFMWGTGVLVSFAFRRAVGFPEIIKSLPVVGSTQTKIATKTASRVSRAPKSNPVIPPPGPKPSTQARRKPPIGQNKKSTESKYRKAFESGEGE